MLHEIRVSGTVVSPLLTRKCPTCTYISQNRGSGNRVSDFCVSGGPPVHYCVTNQSALKCYKIKKFNLSYVKQSRILFYLGTYIKILNFWNSSHELKMLFILYKIQKFGSNCKLLQHYWLNDFLDFLFKKLQIQYSD